MVKMLAKTTVTASWRQRAVRLVTTTPWESDLRHQSTTRLLLFASRPTWGEDDVVEELWTCSRDSTADTVAAGHWTRASSIYTRGNVYVHH